MGSRRTKGAAHKRGRLKQPAAVNALAALQADGAASEGPPGAGSSGKRRNGPGRHSRSRSSADAHRASSEDEEALEEVEQAGQEVYRDPDEDSEDEYDDADEDFYNRRVAKWQAARTSSGARQRRRPTGTSVPGGLEDEEAGDEAPDTAFEGGFLLPGRIYSALFDYQRTAVKWLWELHQQRAGGILGDEMGLGKVRHGRGGVPC